MEGEASADAGFAGRRAAVTGAGGFIGTATCRALAAAGARVVGLDIDPGAAGRVEATGAEFAAADVAVPASVREALAGAELVVHTAALVDEGGDMDEFVRVNVRGTAGVLDAAAAAGAERVVHVSSVVVYGYEHPGEQDERAQLRVYGLPYVDTKSASDRLARRRGAVVIRPGDVYGPGSAPWVLRPARMALAGRLAVPTGERTMLPVYVDDVVAAILAGLERGSPGEAYAAWDGEPRAFEDHFARLAEVVGGQGPRRLPRPLLELAARAMATAARLGGTEAAFSPAAITYVDRRGTVSTDRARRELGWEPRVPYEEGMRLTAEWLRRAL